MIHIITEKIKEKKSEISQMTDSDNKQELIKKINLIENMLQDENCFFNLKMETVFSILEFLGVPEDYIMDIYFELIDPEKIKKNEMFTIREKNKS